MAIPPAGPPPLSEPEYWHDYAIIRNDVHAAMVICYTHRAIKEIPVKDAAILEKMNRAAEFWNITAFSLQNTLFIVLARILDTDPGVHSIYHVLNATTAHREFFLKPALLARKLSIAGAPWDMDVLNEFVRDAWEPGIEHLRAMKKALAPHKERFDAVYKPIRDQIAHIIFKDEASIASLYGKTLKADVDAILCFLYNLIRAIQDLADNAEPPKLEGDHYGYAVRVAEIKGDTERMLRALP